MKRKRMLLILRWGIFQFWNIFQNHNDELDWLCSNPTFKLKIMVKIYFEILNHLLIRHQHQTHKK